MTTAFDQTHVEHLVLTQLFRWFQLYEVPYNAARLANQAAILTDDVVIDRHDHIVAGKLAYFQHLQNHAGWKNAHLLLAHKVEGQDPRHIQLEADIVDQHLLPDGHTLNRAVHYSAVLVPGDDELPVFQSLTVSPLQDLAAQQFRTSYADNRARSFLHRWLYLMETARGSADAFQELLASKFTIAIDAHNGIRGTPAGTTMTTWSQVAEWLVAFSARVNRSSYKVRHVSSRANPDSTITLDVVFTWQAEMISGEMLVGETRHSWILESHPDERFARLRFLNVATGKAYILK